MRAVTVLEGRLVVAERPDPEPGPGEVLVRVAAAGVNSADLLQARGLYPPPPGYPEDIPGLEFAGTVERNGPAAGRFAPGDRVMAVVGGAAQAELVVAHERELMPVPDGVDMNAAGGFPEAFVTSHDALVTQAGLRSGERLLVHGAAGGVGSSAVQLGRLCGARVTATVRSEGLRAGVARLGADRVLAPGEFTGAGPFDVVLELVGGPNIAADVSVLATGGRIVVIGVGAGGHADVDLLALMTRRGRLCASTLRSRPLEEKALCTRRVEAEVLPALASGALTVPVAGTYPMERAQEAYDRFAAGAKLGKVVIDLRSAPA